MCHKRVHEEGFRDPPSPPSHWGRGTWGALAGPGDSGGDPTNANPPLKPTHNSGPKARAANCPSPPLLPGAGRRCLWVKSVDFA